jgi:hypothetical protein
MDVMYKVNHTDHLQEVAPVMVDSHEDYDINSQEDRDGTNQQGNAAPEEDEEIEMTEQFLLEEFPADDFLPDFSFQYQNAVTNIREIIKSFRYGKNKG